MQIELLESRSRSQVRSLRTIVSRHGVCILRGVRRDESAILEHARQLGSPELQIAEELTGPPVMHLRYDREKATRSTRPAYFTNSDFALHTDLSYVPSPPRYLLTLCVDADAMGGGLTTLASIQLAWELLSESDREMLSERCYSFENAPNTGDGVCRDQPIFELQNGNPVWRIRQDTLVCPARAAQAVRKLTDLLERTKTEIPLQPGDLLAIDNHRIAHGRTAFCIPSTRHLLRAYAD
jgi:alpha-ketoglutarate-dependent taurine dioxygenase